MKIDLHIHSTFSDGTYTPLQILGLAKEYSIISITDHDSIGAYNEIYSNIWSMYIIPGIEISTYAPFEIHILGYFLNTKSVELHTELKKINKKRHRDILKIVERLYQTGKILHSIPQLLQKYRPLTFDNLIEEIQMMDDSIQRAECFQDKSLLKDASIGITPEEGIAFIQKYKGISFLAHPKKTMQQNESPLLDWIRILKGYGLQGMECYHESHTKEDVVECLAIASKFQLLVSGGSDFHGANKPGIQLGIGRGNISIPDKVVKDWVRIYESYYFEKRKNQ